jgi:hypothetical protein
MATGIPKVAERYLMVRRPLRRSFELTDKTRLLDALRIASELAGLYESSSTCKSDILRQQSNEMRKAIHTLVTSFTGDPSYFSYRYDPLPPTPTPEELSDLATALFNAYHQHPQNVPAACLGDVERRGIQSEIDEWNAIRSGLELIPNTMFVALRTLLQSQGIARDLPV